MTEPGSGARKPPGYARALIVYALTLVGTVVWGLSDFNYERLPTHIVLRDLLFWPFVVNEGDFWGAAGVLVLLSLWWRRSWLGIALGCGAVFAWVYSGMAVCALKVT